jgi:hypothetical protein
MISTILEPALRHTGNGQPVFAAAEPSSAAMLIVGAVILYACYCGFLLVERKKRGESTVTVSNGMYLVEGIQLRNRALVPKWLGDAILWAFFHRRDTSTQVTITGLAGQRR